MARFARWMYEVQMDNPFIDTRNLAQMAWEEGAREERRRVLGMLQELTEGQPGEKALLFALSKMLEPCLNAPRLGGAAFQAGCWSGLAADV